MDGNFTDASVNGNNGTANGGVTADSTDAQFGQAGNFDGTDDYIDLGDIANITGSITLAAWVKTTATPTVEDIVIGKHQGGNTVGYFLALYNDGRAAIWTSAGGVPDRLIGTTAVHDGQWHHIVGTYDGSTKRIYVDGVLENSIALSGSLATTTTTLKIGALSNPPAAHFPGLIDDVAIWDRALSATDISDIFNN